MLMAEWNGLRACYLGVGYVRRALEFDTRPQQNRGQENRPKNRGAGNCISTAMKNLHRSELSVQRGNAKSVSWLVCFLVKQSQIVVIPDTKTCDYNSSR
jgi:hypothetical protein